MRKSRIKLEDIDQKIVSSIKDNPDRFVDHLKTLSVSIPSWCKLTLVVLKDYDLEFAFFEDAKDFFLTYTKRSLRNDNYELTFICYSREATAEWAMFIPPTLIGTDLKTKVRKSREI